MGKLTKDIFGCSGGEFYPRTYEAGTDCPDDLVDAAVAAGALDKKGAAKIAADAEAARLAQEEADRKAAEDAEAARLAEEEAARKAAEDGVA
jgi:hypothetical protein